jgi:hypothetical protein
MTTDQSVHRVSAQARLSAAKNDVALGSAIEFTPRDASPIKVFVVLGIVDSVKRLPKVRQMVRFMILALEEANFAYPQDSKDVFGRNFTFPKMATSGWYIKFEDVLSKGHVRVTSVHPPESPLKTMSETIEPWGGDWRKKAGEL